MSDPGITPDELDEIAARAALATPGPWTAVVEGRDQALGGGTFIMTSDGAGERGEDIEPSGTTVADIDFIAHAREDVPQLVLEVLRLRALLGLGRPAPHATSDVEVPGLSNRGITPDALDEIAARAALATPGPWTASVEGRDHTSGSTIIMTSDGAGGRGEEDIEPSGMTAADVDFVAHAREDVPRLVLEVLRLRALLGL